jgi:hypothetical protein
VLDFNKTSEGRGSRLNYLLSLESFFKHVTAIFQALTGSPCLLRLWGNRYFLIAWNGLSFSLLSVYTANDFIYFLQNLSEHKCDAFSVSENSVLYRIFLEFPQALSCTDDKFKYAQDMMAQYYQELQPNLSRVLWHHDPFNLSIKSFQG